MTIDEPQGDGLTSVPLRPVFGDESLHTAGRGFDDGRPNVLEFWRWALGDLRANLTVGVLAEWIVARLLNQPIETRPTFSEYDLATTSGKRIEVKARLADARRISVQIEGQRRDQLVTVTLTERWQDNCPGHANGQILTKVELENARETRKKLRQQQQQQR